MPRISHCRHLICTALLGATFASSAQTLERELSVVVEFDAERNWTSQTEERGNEHSTASSTQRYELKTRLQAEPTLYSRNLLDPDQEKRLRAKTIYLARQAKQKLEAAGKPVVIPQTPKQKQDLARQMQQEQFACGGDAECRRNTNTLYAAVFAAAQYPEAFAEDTGPKRYRYYEPASDCNAYSRVTMELNIEGEHYNKSEKEVVPFTEQRQADTENPSDDVPLCQRYLAVIDTQDEAQPLYLENFYLPSATGETVLTENGETQRKTERQPMATNVLGWINTQLKHAPESGSLEEKIPLVQPLNGISEVSGTSTGSANVKMTWSFTPVE